MLYWRGDPNYYRLFDNRFQMSGDAGADVATFMVMAEIEKRVLDGKYKTSLINYDPFDDLGSSFGTHHYDSYDYDDFSCDLPIQMYGDSSKRKIKSVRPKSERPVGLVWLSQQEDDSLDRKTVRAIEAFEKYSKGWGDPVRFSEDGSSRVMFFDGNVPDDAFKHLKDIPNVIDLICGEKSSDAALKHLHHVPALAALDIRGTFTARGLQNLKHVPRLEQLSVSSKNLTDASLKCLRHVPRLRALSWRVDGNFTSSGIESIGQLKHLQELVLTCSLADSELKWLSKSKLQRFTCLGKSGLTDQHVAVFEKLAQRNTLREIAIYDHEFSEEGVKRLNKAFAKICSSITPGRVIKKKQPASNKRNSKNNAKVRFSASKLLNECINEMCDAMAVPKGGFKSLNKISDLPGEQLGEVAICALEKKYPDSPRYLDQRMVLWSLIQTLFRKKMALNAKQVVKLAEAVNKYDLAALISTVEKYQKTSRLPKGAVTKLRKAHSDYERGQLPGHKKLAVRIKSVLDANK